MERTGDAGVAAVSVGIVGGHPVLDLDYGEDSGCDTDLNVVMTDASICGLGQAAPNPIRCVLDYFPHEVGAEVKA